MQAEQLSLIECRVAGARPTDLLQAAVLALHGAASPARWVRLRAAAQAVGPLQRPEVVRFAVACLQLTAQGVTPDVAALQAAWTRFGAELSARRDARPRTPWQPRRWSRG